MDFLQGTSKSTVFLTLSPPPLLPPPPLLSPLSVPSFPSFLSIATWFLSSHTIKLMYVLE